jgi:hypothetical protein
MKYIYSYSAFLYKPFSPLENSKEKSKQTRILAYDFNFLKVHSMENSLDMPQPKKNHICFRDKTCKSNQIFCCLRYAKVYKNQIFLNRHFFKLENFGINTF